MLLELFSSKLVFLPQKIKMRCLEQQVKNEQIKTKNKKRTNFALFLHTLLFARTNAAAVSVS